MIKMLTSILCLLLLGAISLSCGSSQVGSTPGSSSLAGGGIGGTGAIGTGGEVISAPPNEATSPVTLLLGPLNMSGAGATIAGVEVNLDSAEINQNNSTFIKSELRSGMIVRAIAAVDTNKASGLAESLEIKTSFAGPLQSIYTSTSTFLLQGKTFFFSDSSVVYDTTFGSLSLGDDLIVSGIEDSNGDIHATYMRAKDGVAASSDSRFSTLSIHPENLYLDGFPSAFSGNNLSLHGFNLRVTSSTAYKGGTFTDLSLNWRVQAQASLENGIYLVSRIRFEPQATSRFEVVIQNLNTVEQEVSGFDLTFALDEHSLLLDSDSTSLALKDFAPNEWVSISSTSSNSINTLLRMDKISHPGSESLQGAVTEILSPVLVVHNLTLLTYSSSTLFLGSSSNTTSSENFFSSLQIGDTIKARGQRVGTFFDTTEIQLIKP